jgi:NAD+ synthase
MSYIFDSQKAIITAKRFITGKLMESGLEGYVIGLSGGIDSALSATLAVAAVGPEKVFALLMPYRSSSADSVKDARALIDQLGIDHEQVDISPMLDAYYKKIDNTNKLRAGNKMARERMSILFDYAHKMKRMVLGTGNRTEICLGYTTWYGDSACSINPIGELYKTEVRMLAEILEIPASIINKKPSADLWKDQTDEGEIGVTYEEIDRILKRIIDDGVTSMAELEKEGLDRVDISRVISLVNRNVFKRQLPAIAPLGRREIPGSIEIEA